MAHSSGGPRAAAFVLAEEGFPLRGRTAEDRKLIDLLDPVAEAAGYEIVRLRLMSGKESRRLQVMAERPDGTMVVEDCAILSRAISEVMDAADPIAGDYLLEVSSPGIDRPLTRLQDYTDWAGHEARITLGEKIDGRKQFKGDLDGVEGDHVAVTTPDGTRHTIPFAAIEDAKLTMTDRLLKATMPLSMEGADEQELDETAEDTEDQD